MVWQTVAGQVEPAPMKNPPWALQRQSVVTMQLVPPRQHAPAAWARAWVMQSVRAQHSAAAQRSER